MIYDLIIIGGGAAGLTAAAVALSRGKKVLIYECSDRVGKKILLAGNGRCNVGNDRLSPDCYNDEKVAPFLEKSDKVSAFFKSIGLYVKSIDGRVYPYSESGKSVLNLLRAAVGDSAVRTNRPIEKIVKENGLFTVDGETSRAVLIATGSKATVGRESLDLFIPFGHTVTPTIGALCPLNCERGDVKGLAGLRAKVEVKLLDGERIIEKRKGEILFKEDGVSGIVIFELSRFLFGEKTLSVDFLPDVSSETARSFLKEHSAEGFVSRPIAEKVEKQCVSRNVNLVDGLKDYRIKRVKRADFKHAQVMQGGIPLGEFDERLQSKFTPGLYAAGEVLDVDGDCGGYNLHWAFLTGVIVGESV